jgi:hypothetical protein
MVPRRVPRAECDWRMVARRAVGDVMRFMTGGGWRRDAVHDRWGLAT